MKTKTLFFSDLSVNNVGKVITGMTHDIGMDPDDIPDMVAVQSPSGHRRMVFCINEDSTYEAKGMAIIYETELLDEGWILVLFIGKSPEPDWEKVEVISYTDKGVPYAPDPVKFE